MTSDEVGVRDVEIVSQRAVIARLLDGWEPNQEKNA